jgi:hypothetical protein
MPFVNPQLLSERVSKYKPLLSSDVGNGVIFLLEKRSNWSKGGNCRIILQTPAKAVKEKEKLKALIAKSSDEGDLLENEWGYVLKELPNLVPKSQMDPPDFFNWIVAHFNMLYTKERIDAVETVNAVAAASVMNTTLPRQNTLLAPGATPLGIPPSGAISGIPEGPPSPSVSPAPRTRNSFSSESSPDKPSPLEPALARNPGVVKQIRFSPDTAQNEDDEIPSRVSSPPHAFVTENFKHLPPKVLAVGIAFNFLLMLVHEMIPRAMFAGLLVVLNTLVLQYWIWYKMSFTPKPATKKHAAKPPVRSTTAPRPTFAPSSAPLSPTPEEEKSRKLGVHLTEDLPNKIVQELDRASKLLPEPPADIAEEDVKIDEKLTPGITAMRMNPDGKAPEESKFFAEWNWVPSDTFMVRQGPDYSVNKKKAPSEEAIYEVVAVDNYGLERKLWHVGRFFDLSKLKDVNPPRDSVVSESKESPEGSATDASRSIREGDMIELPEVLIINVLCPLYAPGMFAPVVDGEGFMSTVFCKLSAESKRRLKIGKPTPAMQLFKRFVEEAQFDGSMRGRVKCIARANNADELSLGGVVRGLITRYNATPFLIHDGEGEYFKGDGYFEMDIDVHKFSTLARNGFYHLKHMMNLMRNDYAFVIEGRTDDELPEQLLTTVQMFDVHTMTSPQFPAKMDSE